MRGAPAYFRLYPFRRCGSNLFNSGSTSERGPGRLISTQQSLPINAPTKASETTRVSMELNYRRSDEGQQQALKQSPSAGNSFYDFVRPEEIEMAHKIEVQGMDKHFGPSSDTLILSFFF